MIYLPLHIMETCWMTAYNSTGSLNNIIYSQKNNYSLQKKEAKRSSEGQSQYNKSK